MKKPHFRGENTVLVERRRRDSNPRNLTVQRFSRPLAENAKSLKNKGVTNNKSCRGAATGAKTPEIDPDLQRVIDVWESLPKAIKAAIISLAGAGGEE